MDRRYASDSQWFVSPLIDLREFLETAYEAESSTYKAMGRPHHSVVKEETYHQEQLLNDFMKTVECSRGTAKNLFETQLNLENFVEDPKVEKTKRNWDDDMADEKVDAEPRLRIHDAINERNRLQNVPWKKNEYLRRLKYYRCGELDLSLKKSHTQWNDPCAKDIVITVDANIPYSRTVQPEDANGCRLIQPQAKFILRGDTELYELRKRLVCVNDMMVQLTEGREYEPPDMATSSMALFPSAFIYIHDTFYVDLSAEGAEDISFPVREFMARKKIFDPVKAKSMEGVKIIDLKLRLGQPYVFVHSGSCEHLLIFHDLALLHKTDVQDLSRYPLQTYEKVNTVKCGGCSVNYATYQVVNCDRLPTAVTFFCDECFKEFNYVNGQKLGNFKAYPYFHMNRISFE